MLALQSFHWSVTYSYFHCLPLSQKGADELKKIMKDLTLEDTTQGITNSVTSESINCAFYRSI